MNLKISGENKDLRKALRYARKALEMMRALLEAQLRRNSKTNGKHQKN